MSPCEYSHSKIFNVPVFAGVDKAVDSSVERMGMPKNFAFSANR